MPDQLPGADLPIWIAAQRAVSRYEGSLPETMLKSYIETKQSEGYVRLDSE